MKYYQGYEQIYAAAKQAGADRYNNPPQASLAEMYDTSLLPPGGRVLDLGCGEGQFSLLFAGEGYQVLGLDISPSAVEWACQAAEAAGQDRAAFVVGDVTDLVGIGACQFEIVLSIHCYHCLTDPADRAAHLQEAWRVLRPGGVFVFDNMAAPEEEDLPRFRRWHLERGGIVREEASGVTTSADSTEPYTIQRPAGSGQVEFQIPNAIALAHRFYARMDHVLHQLHEIGFEILFAGVQEPDPERLSELKFIHGDNVVYARKPANH